MSRLSGSADHAVHRRAIGPQMLALRGDALFLFDQPSLECVARDRVINNPTYYPTMKGNRIMHTNTLLRGLSALAFAGLLAGCSTTKTTQETAVPKSGVVCPECRTVTLGPFPSGAEWRGGPPAMVRRHECSGCRGVFSIYGEGPQYRHECSVCKQSPYSCNVNSH